METDMSWCVRCADCELHEQRASRLAADRLAAAHRRVDAHEVGVVASQASRASECADEATRPS